MKSLTSVFSEYSVAMVTPPLSIYFHTDCAVEDYKAWKNYCTSDSSPSVSRL